MNCHHNHVQLAKSRTCYAVPSPVFPDLRQFCGITVLETYDHLLIVCCDASNAIRLRQTSVIGAFSPNQDAGQFPQQTTTGDGSPHSIQRAMERLKPTGILQRSPMPGDDA
jgi:hypothetical protein